MTLRSGVRMLWLGAALALATGCATDPPRVMPAEASDPRVTDWPGWYTLPTGEHLFVTWSATLGAMVYDFAAYDVGRLVPAAGDSALWRRSGGRPAWAARVIAPSAPERAGIRYRDEHGNEQFAARDTQPPYEQRLVAYASGGDSIRGTLFVPHGAGPHAAAVMIHGSGESDRDNIWYMGIADTLARRGIAVLIPDKRGAGRSEGEWRETSFERFIDDALAGLETLRAMERIDASRVGLLGISQAGWIAPPAAVRSRHVAFVVVISGSVVTPNQQLLHESRASMRQAGWPAPLAALVAHPAAAVARAKRPGFWKANGEYDPLPDWRAMRVPGLLILGRADEHDNVPVARSIERFESLLGAERAAPLALRVFENSGHGIEDPSTGRYRSDFLMALGDWITGTTGTEETARGIARPRGAR